MRPSSLVEKLEKAWKRRKDYVQKNSLEAFRLVHGEGDGLGGISIDVYGGDFFILLREAAWLAHREALKAALDIFRKPLGLSPSQYFLTSNFPGGKEASLDSSSKAKVRPVREGDLLFEIHLGEGLHTGLFLDQRENRRWLRSVSREKRVLNLFSYTGAFSVAALKGGAEEVVSVDLSKNSLNWLERNLLLNRLDPGRSQAHAADVYDFLKKAEKKGERFDLIVLDPPTFSRGKKKTFSTERDLGQLVERCAERLFPKGNLFISVNTRHLNPAQFTDKIRRAVTPFQLKILKTFRLPPDFPLGPQEMKNPHLKSCQVG